jgi:hypothetical protein
MAWHLRCTLIRSFRDCKSPMNGRTASKRWQGGSVVCMTSGPQSMPRMHTALTPHKLLDARTILPRSSNNIRIRHVDTACAALQSAGSVYQLSDHDGCHDSDRIAQSPRSLIVTRIEALEQVIHCKRVDAILEGQEGVAFGCVQVHRH